jgi:hypothetical protein
MRRLITAVVGCAAVAVAALAGAPVADAGPLEGQALAAGTFFSGTYTPGQAVDWHKPAALNVVYDVGLSPQGASSSTPCAFEVTRDWYKQLPSGAREYWWTLKNVGTISCATQVQLTEQASNAALGPYALDPGGSTAKEWNIDLGKPVYQVGASPTGATPSSACAMEITRTWYGRTASGGVHVFAILKNVGTIACSAQIRFTNKTSAQNFLQLPVIAAGATTSKTWTNVDPVTSAYWSGSIPSSSNVNCKLELTRKVYAQRVTAAGTKRELQLQIKNVGAVACSGQVRFAVVAP